MAQIKSENNAKYLLRVGMTLAIPQCISTLRINSFDFMEAHLNV